MKKRKRILMRLTMGEKKRIVKSYRDAKSGEKIDVLLSNNVTRSMVLRWARGECLGDIGRPRKDKK
jgi:hypothetical protein